MSTVGGNPPGWRPDPMSRHQYRFWDGVDWTDQVSDNSQVGVDPVQAPQSPVGAPAPAPQGSSTALRLVLIGAGVAVVVIGGLFVYKALSDGGSNGSDASSGTISKDGDLVVKQVDLKEGDAIRVLVTPDSDLDAEVALAAPPEVLLASDLSFLSDASASDFSFSAFFSGTDALGNCNISSDDFSVAVSDVSCNGDGVLPYSIAGSFGPGEQEYLTAIIPADGNYAVIVRGGRRVHRRLRDEVRPVRDGHHRER